MRLTLDLDKPATEADARAAHAAVEYILGVAARLYRTASGGHHVETDNVPGLTMLDHLALRRYLGDDPARIKRDVARIAARRAWDFLWSTKRGVQRVRVL